MGNTATILEEADNAQSFTITDAMNGTPRCTSIEMALSNYDKKRKLGIIHIPTSSSVNETLDAFLAIKFLPLKADFDVIGHCIEYIGHCDHFEESKIGDELRKYTIQVQKITDEDTEEVTYDYSLLT